MGKDSVQYRICDNGSPSLCDTAWVIIEVITTPAVGNQPPVALDDAGLTHPGTLVTITVKGNDFDPDGGVLGSPSVVTPPTNGTIVINGDGTVTYTPTSPTFVGSDVFTYKICDNGSPSLCDTATVTIGILPANNPPIAVNDIAVTPQDKPVVGNVMTNDDDPDSDPITAVTTLMSNPMKGTVVLNTNGVFTYTPNTGQTGEDKFCYTITDGALKDTACVTINIIPNPIIGNDKPVANDDATQTPMNTNVSINVKSNDTDPDGNGTLGIPSPLSTTTVKGGTMTNNNDGTFTYSPPTGFIGKDSVQYRICDNGSPSLCDTAWVTIEVIPTPAVGNQPPVAMDDAALTNMGTPVTIAIKTNDFDPDGGILGTPAVVTSPTNGSVVVNPDGTVTYTPTSPTFVGSDVFTYKICDNGSPSKCDTATVTIGILPPLPAVTVVANMDIAGTIAGTLVNIPILTNDTDNGAGATLSNVTTPTITRNPTKGTASIKPDGTIDYTPNAAANGSDTLIYQICDQISTTTCDTALVVINIGIRLLPRAYLLGCYNETTSLMHDSLRRKNLIPLQQPYNQTEYSDNTYTGTETVTPSVLTTVGNNAIVDWVLVELRSPTDPKNILFRRAALIQRDGDIVDVDGVSPVMFGSTSPASYYVSVKHRNHLGVLTALAQPLTFVPLVVDFTLTTTDNYKTTSLDKDFAQKPTANNKRAMWMGNINKDNMVIFQGPNNDVGQLYLNVLTDSNNGGFLANYILNGYLRGDVDMDGLTIYQGPGNEVDKVFFEVVLHPINTTYLYNFIINEQIPK
ncbi:MAG: tandem-95 repeat protein [Saprospiraceae bacterium]|nr:tandem-95 repeat protein [Saprospiraceae bacterium]